MAKKYDIVEYKHFSFKVGSGGYKSAVEQLNKFGKFGWRLINEIEEVIGSPHYYEGLFMRISKG